MKSNPLFVLLIVLLNACTPSQNTGFIVEDYLNNIQVLEENNEFLKEKIAKAINANPSRNTIHKENIELSCSLFSTIYSELNILMNEKNSDFTKTEFKRLYSSSLEIATKIKDIINKHPPYIDKSVYENDVFEGISKDSFWNELINNTNTKNIKIAFAKLHLELKKSENNLFVFYDKLLSEGVIKCPGPIARVVAPSSYIMCGSFFEAEVHLFSYGHYNIEDIVRIVVNGNEIPFWGSYGVYKVKAPNYAGIHKVEGFIEIDGLDGIEKHEFITEWQSFIPAVVFEFDEYQKVKSNEETEFAIHIPGFRQEDIIVETSKGKITKLKGIGKYKILVDEKPNTQFLINVSVKMPDGSIRKMGERKMMVE